MQPSTGISSTTAARFNPHRPRRADATSLITDISWDAVFQSSPAPKGRCNERRRQMLLRADAVSILTGPEGPMQRRVVIRVVLESVSILTGPEGPMQRVLSAQRAGAGVVSILTGPEGPMQRQRDLLRGLANEAVSILTGPEGPMQPCGPSGVHSARQFQSSPAPKGRCNHPLDEQIHRRVVSILTGPEGPMQRREARAVPVPMEVSILTGPEGPMQRGVAGVRRALAVSILTGPEGPMQLR